MSKDFSYEIIPDFDFVIEEGQNNSTNLRKISWNGREPKLDIRKWAYNDGEERMLRGCTLTEEGGNELACILVENGYGDTNRLLKALSKRSDYNSDVVNESDGSVNPPTNVQPSIVGLIEIGSPFSATKSSIGSPPSVSK